MPPPAETRTCYQRAFALSSSSRTFMPAKRAFLRCSAARLAEAERLASEAGAVVTRDTIEIPKKILFAVGKDSLLPESDPVLQDLAALRRGGARAQPPRGVHDPA